MPTLRAMACGALALSMWGAPAMAEWTLWHEEDFSRRNNLDAAFWRSEQGFVRNREAQYYRAANATVEAGALVLEARREAVPNAAYQPGSRDWRFSRQKSAYTSAALVSRDPLHFGRLEVVARSPAGAGTWPAIWLLHEGDGIYGEIDVFEAVGKHPDLVFSAVHYGREARTRRHRNASLQVPAVAGAWHTHTLEWTPERIRTFFNGQLVFSFDPAQAAEGGVDPLRQPMHVHLNLALGGSWGGDIDDGRLPARFEIASIRIWRWTPGASGQAQDALPKPLEIPGAVPRWGR